MIKIAIIGGGAAGMICALRLARCGYSVSVFERGARLGRKLSATGNGQGNITNLNMDAAHYFSDDNEKLARALSRYGAEEFIAFLEDLGGIFLPDGRGRVYPAGRQASAITDILRRELARLKVKVRLNAYVEKLTHNGKFTVYAEGKQMCFDAVVLAAGGRAAENFGTDGSAYALAKSFGHTVTDLRPALVPLRCDIDSVRGLKGIRVDGLLRVVRGGSEIYRCRGDILFTDNGVSGDAVFRASSYTQEGDKLVCDLLPDASEERLEKTLKGAGEDCLLCVVNNGLGRALYKRAGGDKKRLVSLIKNFPLEVKGSLGFSRAQVTRGGVPLSETDEFFMSRKCAGLYFAGEILNADGECGGYNLQWAFTSASCVSEGIHETYAS